MATRTNKKILLASYAEREPTESNFKYVEEPVGEVPEGQFLVKVLHLSLDPYMRGKMRDYGGKVDGYVRSHPLNTPMLGGGVGQIVESKSDKWKVGTLVVGQFGWQSYALSDGTGGIYAVDDKYAPASAFIGVLGMPGFSAYAGLLKIGEPKEGETLVVSGGAGAVGSVVGQIGKIKGCRVIGIAGSDDKVKWMTEEAGFDAGINYKTTKDLAAAVKEYAPKGIDVYFDNVGGETLEIMLDQMNTFGRIVACGAISQYNKPKSEMYGVKNLTNLITKQLTFKGFLVFTYYKEMPTFLKEAAGWMAEGKLKYKQTEVDGIENAPKAFIKLFDGTKFGKLVVNVAQKE